jgi:hypothetical protein
MKVDAQTSNENESWHLVVTSGGARGGGQGGPLFFAPHFAPPQKNVLVTESD